MAKKKKIAQAPREMTHRQLSHHKRQLRRQRIILFGGIAVIIAIILIIVGGWAFGDYFPLHKTIIQVYDTKFNIAYFIDRLKLVVVSQSSSNSPTSSSSVGSMASSLKSVIIQGELERQGAAKFGVKVSDADVLNLLKSSNIPVTAASKDTAIGQLLPDKLKKDYFSTVVPVSDNEVYMKAIMCEDENVAQTVRERMLNGDNITTLATEYAQGYFSQEYKGDFGLHSAAVLRSEYIPDVPINYAFSPNVTVGTVSLPLSDNTSYKQRGYWLIRVNDKPSNTSANVTAILLSNEPLAVSVRAQIEAGDNVTALADQYSQFTDVGQHGELGVVKFSDNISSDFNGYVFNPATKLGEWSNPVRDNYQWTQGGYWVVQVVDRQDDAKLSDDDRSKLIDKAYEDWTSGLTTAAAGNTHDYLTDKLLQWAVDRVTRELKLE